MAALGLPDCWIGAGFVRDAVWDHLHGRKVAQPTGDVDVLWFDAAATSVQDRAIEAGLKTVVPSGKWSVKNQARMHLRNGDAPYSSVSDAMRHWPETATAVAARIGHGGDIEINAPLGLEDLFALILRPTAQFLSEKLPIFVERVSSKQWLTRYPDLVLKMPTRV